MNTDFSANCKDELPHLWRFAIHLCGSRDNAEELVQKTILRALEKRQQFVEHSNLRSWLFSILHSVWKNELRAQAIRKNTHFGTNNVDEISAQQSSGSTHHLLNQVLEQVNKLPEAQRTVMLLICVNGYSYQESSDILDVPIGTIMSRLARARLTIGRIFNEHPHDKGDGQSSEQNTDQSENSQPPAVRGVQREDR